MQKGSLWLAAIIAAGLAMPSTIAIADETESSIARGGRLYDKWFGENKAKKPTQSHAAYPAKGEYSKDATWRCKECHGWDNLGKDGAYGSGKHATGIVGIRGAANGDVAKIGAVLRDRTHNYSEVRYTELAPTRFKDFWRE